MDRHPTAKVQQGKRTQTSKTVPAARKKDPAVVRLSRPAVGSARSLAFGELHAVAAYVRLHYKLEVFLGTGAALSADGESGPPEVELALALFPAHAQRSCR